MSIIDHGQGTSEQPDNIRAESADEALRRWAQEHPDLAAQALRNARTPTEPQSTVESHSTRNKLLASGLAVLTAGVGYFAFGRGDDSSDVPRNVLSSTSAPVVPGNPTGGENGSTKDPETKQDVDLIVFPGFLPDGSADPAGGTDRMQGIESVSENLEFVHPPIGDQDPVLVKLVLGGGMVRRLGYYNSAVAQDPTPLNGNSVDADGIVTRNDALKNSAKDTLFTKSGAKSPFGKAYFQLLDNNASARENKTLEKIMSYDDFGQPVTFGDATLSREGNAGQTVQQYTIETGLADGKRYYLIMDGRYDDNGDFIWKITGSKEK